MYVVQTTNNVPSRLLPIRQWPHGNSCTWAHDVRGYTLLVSMNQGALNTSSKEHNKTG